MADSDTTPISPSQGTGAWRSGPMVIFCLSLLLMITPPNPATAFSRGPISLPALQVEGAQLRPIGGGEQGERVERIGRGDPALDRRLDHLLEGGGYLLVTRDTLISASEVVPRSILLLNATLILEGTVEGDLIGVGGDLFLRPTARVEGDIMNLAGGYYPSELADPRGVTIDRPLARYRATEIAGGWVIEGMREVDHIVLDGLLGFHPPTYERVNALGIRWGARYLTSGDPAAGFVVHGWTGYMSGRGALEGGLEVSRRWERAALALGIANETATNDRWIRGDLRNTISFLWDGDDYRNYYLTRRAYLQFDRTFGDRRRGAYLIIRGEHEDDRSLPMVHAWTIVGGDESRLNPPIDEGTIVGVTTSLRGHWLGRSLAWEVGGRVEAAGSLLGGEHTFELFAIDGRFGMDAIADHALLIRWYLQGPLLGSRVLPRQRWSILGGSGTLPAYPIGEFHGDHVALMESRYVMPLPESLALPILGRPDLEVAHALGNAWARGMNRDLLQSLELRIRFSFLYLRVATDPVEPRDHTRFGVGITSPFAERFPWRHD